MEILTTMNLQDSMYIVPQKVTREPLTVLMGGIPTEVRSECTHEPGSSGCGSTGGIDLPTLQRHGRLFRMESNAVCTRLPGHVQQVTMCAVEGTSP